jgi:pyruvate dehydrogenase E2 component (dihydrolipoamide acetyltransferase)
MAVEIVIPRLGLLMEEGSVVKWYKQDGEAVRKGELLFTLEYEKTMEDVESPGEGVLHIAPDIPSDPLPIGTVVAVITAAGEPAPTLSPPRPSGGTHVAQAAGGERSALAPGLPPSPQPAPRTEKKATPAAKQRCREAGIDWREVQGSGPEGRVELRDVEQHLQPRGRGGARQPEKSQPPPAGTESSPISGVRRSMARRMLESAQATAPVTLFTEVDAGELVRRRNTGGEASYTEMIIHLTAQVLVRFPEMNSSLDGERILEHHRIDIGVAVDTQRGLLVPVLRDVAAKTLSQVATECRALIAAARGGTLKGSEMSGATFTITNLGMFDIDGFTPIIDLPQCAVLGVGRIREKPAVRNGQVVAQPLAVLSLTFDHRLADGAQAARFLKALKERIEQAGPRGAVV